MEVDAGNSLITSYFGGQIQTVKYESEEEKLKVIGKRILLECQARIGYGYKNGTELMNRVDAAMQIANSKPPV